MRLYDSEALLHLLLACPQLLLFQGKGVQFLKENMCCLQSVQISNLARWLVAPVLFDRVSQGNQKYCPDTLLLRPEACSFHRLWKARPHPKYQKRLDWNFRVIGEHQDQDQNMHHCYREQRLCIWERLYTLSPCPFLF